MLTARQGELLHLLVGDYIGSASSVSSAGLVRRHGLTFSPATVRHELAELEEAGYVGRPHTSAGVVPTERGYRYYVENQAGDLELPAAQQRTIRHQFHQVEQEEESWLRLAVATLAHAAMALALVTPLRTPVSRLRAIELVPLEEGRALLVLVLGSGQLRRATLHLAQPMPTEDLERIAHRLTALWTGRARDEIAQEGMAGDTVIAQLRAVVLALMAQAEEELAQEPYLYGFSQVLSQPEFAETSPLRGLLQALEDGRLVPALRSSDLTVGHIRVIIGEEHAEDFLRPYGAVVAAYGGEARQGTVAVLGPMRMAYATAIPSVRYLAQILTELAEEAALPHGERHG